MVRFAPGGMVRAAKRPEGSGTRRRETALPVPTEEKEQRTVVEWLRLAGVLFTHVPNGGFRTKTEAGILKALGVSKGCPDLLIFDPPPNGGYVGAAIELKRLKGGRISPEQQDWINNLIDRHWFALVCHGAGDAIDVLTRLGYGRRR